ncbi:hypothetical protein [Peribacillus simplex]
MTADIQVHYWRSINVYIELIHRQMIIIEGKVHRDDGDFALYRQGTFSI